MLYKLGRFLQLAGLLITPAGMAGNLIDPQRVGVWPMLTVAAVGTDWFEAAVSPETLSRTTLALRSPGDRVNLERALAYGEARGVEVRFTWATLDPRAQARYVMAGMAPRFTSRSQARSTTSWGGAR